MMTDYLERLASAPSEVLSALLFLHENPQDFIEHWRYTGRWRQYYTAPWRRLVEDGFIQFHHEKKRQKSRAVYTLADENVTWLLIGVLELILRKIERQRCDVRSFLRYASAGPDRGDFEQVLRYKADRRPNA